jgi:hypothetical protein
LEAFKTTILGGLQASGCNGLILAVVLQSLMATFQVLAHLIAKGISMGKLRDSLDKLKSALVSLETKLKEAEINAAKLDTNLNQRFEAGLKAGVEMLYLYLVEKFKKNNDTYAAHLSDTILSHKDENVLKFVQAISEGKADTLKWFAAWEKFISDDVKALKSEVDGIYPLVTDVNNRIEKKREAWFQSKKYKAKIGAYADSLDQCIKLAKSLGSMPDEFRPCMNKSSIEKIKFTVNTDLKELESDSMLVNLKTELKNAESRAKAGIVSRRKFREGGDLKEATAMLSKWAQEADEMETESEEGDVKTVPFNPKLKNVIIKDGSTLIASAKQGTYDEKKKLLVADVVEWKVKGQDPLDLLQKKFKITADYVESSQGKVSGDMKMVKLNGGLKAATYQG